MADSKFFPSTEAQALALEWLRQQDLSHLTPEDVLAEYRKAYSAIEQKVQEKVAKDFQRLNR